MCLLPARGELKTRLPMQQAPVNFFVTRIGSQRSCSIHPHRPAAAMITEPGCETDYSAAKPRQVLRCYSPRAVGFTPYDPDHPDRLRRTFLEM